MPTIYKTKSKYRAVKTIIDGIKFDSKKEAARYVHLKILERTKDISALEIQPKFEIVVEGVKICVYRADFAYFCERTGKRIVEDVKGVKTPVYALKKKLVKAVHGIDILET